MKRILVVDDAAFMRSALKMMLEKHEFEVIGEAGNGVEAIQRYQELRPDIVTMDITMPEMDGITAVKHIHSLDPQAKIIMISAMGQKDMVMEAIASGARGFIVKPFKEGDVVETLSKT